MRFLVIIALTVLFLFFSTILIVVFTPFSFIQNSVEKMINKDGVVEVKFNHPINYRLADGLNFKFMNIEYKSEDLDFNLKEILMNIDQRFDSKKIKVKKVKLHLNELVIKNLKTHSSFKNNEVSKANKNDNKLKIEKVMIDNVEFVVDKLVILEKVYSNIVLKIDNINIDPQNQDFNGKLDFKIGEPLLLSLKSHFLKNHQFEFVTDIIIYNIRDLLDLFQFNYDQLDGSTSINIKTTFTDITKPKIVKADFILDSRNLIFKGKNLDKILDAYIDSRSIGILDAAGFVALGPLGLIYSKTADLGKVGIKGLASGETNFRHLYIDTYLEGDKLYLKDFAAATQKHLIVFNGQIDISENYQLNNFSVASVDKSGCSIFQQDIEGSLLDPKISKLKTVTGELFSSVIGIIKKTGNLLMGKCDTYYKGKVAHP